MHIVLARYNNNKEAQLLLEKKQYSIYSSCCITDLHGHSKSMILMSS